MLELVVKEGEVYNEQTNTFITIPSRKLRLEHSLVSVSKWEAHYKKPFMSKDDKTNDEVLYYIKCMTIDQNVDPMVYSMLDSENFKMVEEYIADKMTATWFTNKNKKHTNEVITSEIIYYWMIALQIPMKCEKWHLNRLLTLIDVCNIKNEQPKKMPKSEVMAQHRALNAARRNKMRAKR